MSRVLFHRPARALAPRQPSDPIVLPVPPQPVGRDSNSSWIYLLMPLLSSVSMASYMVMEGKKLLVLLGICFVLLSTGVTVGVRMQMTGTQRRARARMRDRYLEHLAEIRAGARRTAADQRAVAAWSEPSPYRLDAIVRRRRRIWERRAADPDFLRVRVGSGHAPLVSPIRTAPRQDLTVEYDPQAKAAADRLIAATARVGGQPALLDLARSGVVSILGPAGTARAAARALLCQVAVLHAPDDVAIAVSAGGDGEHWTWATWLPHTHETAQDPPEQAERETDTADADADGAGGEVAALVSEGFDGIADFVEGRLRELAQDRDRRRTHPLGDRTAQQAPVRRHLIVVLDCYDPRSAWARSAAAAELLEAAGPHSGVTVICVVGREGDEPTRADVRMRLDGEGRLELEARRADLVVQVSDARADLPDTVLCEHIARGLAPLRLSAEGEEVLARTMALPAMLGIADAGEFDPRRLWVGASDEDVLRIPLGFDGDGRPMVLDLKESAQGGMGPHGLIVGATGSGKSELLRTLVTGLAARHSPEQLSFVLVDFKGGATFAGVTGLPHVAGMITNLVDDLALVDRVKSALVGEQQRRQRMLRDAGDVDTAREYQVRRAAGHTMPDGRPMEPLPHLLVIVDEFGELLSRRPDFIDLFVQIGRVGRSLGIHLLLATQRLEEGRLRGLGANLSFRICLRTFSAAESRAVIGTPDAYRLPPIPGSAYLKVAESLYTRFRVAHVSGPYEAVRGADPGAAAAARIRPFGLRARPAPAGDERERPPARRPAPVGPTEMQVLVATLARYGTSAHQVWLPPLPSALPLDAVLGPVTDRPGRGVCAEWWSERGTLRFPLGVVDLPLEQRQHPLVMDLAREHGNLALIGAPQSGKSTFLRTLILSAMATHTPEEVQFLCVDYGGGTLTPLEAAPHVSGVAGRQEPGRVRRALAEAANLVAERERLFQDLGIDSAAEFRRRRAEGRLPEGCRGADVFLVVDGWGALRGELADANGLVLDIAARGLGAAVHVVLSSNRWADVRMPLRDTMGGRLELRLNDPAESEINRRLARGFAVGVPGRGLAPPGVQFQIALPRVDGEESVQKLAQAQEEILARAAQGWAGAAAPPIRTLPDLVSAAELAAPAEGARGVPIGVDENGTDPVLLDLTDKDPHLAVLGDSGSGKSAFLRTWLAGLVRGSSPNQTRVIVVDYRRSLIGAVPADHLGAYAGDARAARFYAEQVAAKLAERLPPPDVTPRQLRERSWWQGPEFYVVVDDYDLLGGRERPLAVLEEFVPHAREVGLHLVLARRISGIARGQVSDTLLHRLRELGGTGLVLSGDPREGVVFGDQRAAVRVPGRAVFVRRSAPATLIQLALGESEPDGDGAAGPSTAGPSTALPAEASRIEHG